jgi:phosphate transport system protein
MVDLQKPVTIDISRDQLSMMAKLVERAVELSTKALFEQNILLARNIIEADKAINSYEIDVDNSTYGMLVASNIPPDMLRSIISIQKINAMLERIGDHAVNIAESAMNIASLGYQNTFLALPDMAGLCKKMLADALASFFKQDLALAQDVLTRDDTVDQLNRSVTDEVKSKILCGEMGDLSLERGMELIRVSKNL